MKKNKLYLFLIFLFSLNGIYAQDSLSVYLNHKPCSDCLCYLVDSDDNVFSVKRLNEQGVMLFKNIQEYNRISKINIESFDQYCSVNFLEKLNKNLSTINCNYNEEVITNAVKLNEVTVISGKKIIEDKGDRIVYNVASDSSITSINATELLRKAPLVTMDAGGRPSIKGNSNILILVNGKKKSGLSSTQVLNSIPSNDIDRVEIITSPGVRYESEGTSDAINIITKNKISVNSALELASGLGTTGSHLFANYLHKLRDSISISTSFSSLIYYPKLSSRYKIFNNTENNEINLDGNNNGNINYFAVNYLQEKKYGELNFFFNYYGSNEVSVENGNDINSEINNSYNYFQLKSENIINLNQSGKIELSTGFSNLPVSNYSDISGIIQNSTSSITNYFIASDFNIDVNKKLTFSFGAKLDLDFINGDNELNISNTNLIQNYTIRKSLNSVYSEFNYKLNNRSKFTLGLRNESYLLYADKELTQKINSLFYNINYNNKISATSTISANFSKRIERPTLNQLLPISFNVNPFLLSVGEPALEPGFNYTLDLGVSNYMGKTFIKVSPFVSLVKDKISNFLITQDLLNNFSSSPVNLSNYLTYGSTFWVTTKLIKNKVNLNYGLDLIFNKLNYKTFENSGLQVFNKINTSFALGKTVDINLFGSFISKGFLIQGFKNSYTYSNLSLKKKFSENLSLSLSVDNPFRKGFRSIENYDLTRLNYSAEQVFFDRGIRFMFVYRIGDLNKSKINKQQLDKINLLNKN